MCSFNKHLLRAYYVPGTLAWSKDTAAKKAVKVLALKGLTF